MTHSVPWLLTKLTTDLSVPFLSSSSLILIRSFRAPIKLLPLSLKIFSGLPRRAVNHFNERMNAFLVRRVTISK